MDYRISCLNWNGVPDNREFEFNGNDADDKALKLYDKVVRHNKNSETRERGTNFKLVRIDQREKTTILAGSD